MFIAIREAEQAFEKQLLFIQQETHLTVPSHDQIVYIVLDNLILVDIFGCGCVPSTQTNMFNIPFNANDLRLIVFSLLSIGLSAWSIVIARNFKRITTKLSYCIAVILLNVTLTMWGVKTFMWA